MDRIERYQFVAVIATKGKTTTDSMMACCESLERSLQEYRSNLHDS